MQITIRPTEKMIRFAGELAQVWEGETESGVKVVGLVSFPRLAGELDELERPLPPEPARPTLHLRVIWTN